MKQLIINAMDVAACFSIGSMVFRMMYGQAYTRIVNYHDTPADFEANLERQLQFFQRHFVNCNEADLAELITDGRWPHDKPDLMLSFDDGLYSNYTVAAPILERYGFRGMFFVPTALIGAADDDNIDAQHSPADHDIYPRGASMGSRRWFMNWGELRDLKNRGHGIGVHSRNHVRLSDKLDSATLDEEILTARQEFESNIAQIPQSFCWVGGEEWSYGRQAARKIVDSGYRFGFMTNLAPVVAETDPFRLQRTNIEADWPMANVRFYLSGLMDIAYGPKRRRLARHLP